MISKYISEKEATYSEKAVLNGIANTPNDTELESMKHVATNIFDKCREYFGGALGVNSFFRNKQVNTLVGGSSTSQHTKGEAIDINANRYGTTTNFKLFIYIARNLEFDQLIWEFGTDKEPKWVHVSLKKNGKNRGQILQAKKVIVTEKNDKGELKKIERTKYFDITSSYKK